MFFLKSKLKYSFTLLLFTLFFLFTPLSVLAATCNCTLGVQGMEEGSGVPSNCNEEISISVDDSGVVTIPEVFNKNYSRLKECVSNPFALTPRGREVECGRGNTDNVADPNNSRRSFNVRINCQEEQTEATSKEQQKETMSNSNIINQLNSLDKIKSSGSSASQGVSNIIGKAIVLILQFAGTAALLMFIYGGLLIMVSQGQSDKYQKGAKIMMWSAIGIIVMLSSYGILNFILAGLGA